MISSLCMLCLKGMACYKVSKGNATVERSVDGIPLLFLFWSAVNKPNKWTLTKRQLGPLGSLWLIYYYK